MSIIKQSTLKTLQKSYALLSVLTDAQLCNVSVPPYHSSIGTHIRHILDFYNCIFNLNADNKIDLTDRGRNKEIETNCSCAQRYLEEIIKKLNSVNFKIKETVCVIDDLGMGKIEIPYTYGALLAHANSHTIHHYAIINYILNGLNIDFNDEDFGYNPTTPNTFA
ncbi:hypothetical protein BWZ22_00590 [Seonamhaeicola sp. S2-3]|uniref:DinB family protein n=1 Tax=Seonamhaeicola sp. S2-3 TaxID=1936081 RepID=UPI000972A022|nr:DinB family protein [Seonamhaeicola sp. S2-3]APY09833.1 hypothetical protein BWZ22_00590 [Seonamhaeicola sp. S2-3]